MKLATLFSLALFPLFAASTFAAAPVVAHPAPLFSTATAAPVRSSQPAAAEDHDVRACTPTGGACYAEDSWTCCSKICVFSLCE